MKTKSFARTLIAATWLVFTACGSEGPVELAMNDRSGVQKAQEFVQQESECEETGIGLGLYFFNGLWNPDLSPFPDPERPTALHIVDGYERFPQEIILIASVPTTEALGLEPLIEGSDFSGLNWNGVEEVDEDWRLEVSGFTWQRQVFYRDAKWMKKDSELKIIVRNTAGHKLNDHKVKLGKDDKWKHSDDMFERRFVARVLSTNCVAEGDCSNPDAVHLAEGLAQLRTNLHPHDTFKISPQAALLELKWSVDPGRVWEVPIVHDGPLSTGYGLNVALSEVNAPARGYYLPGEQISIRITHQDGGGNPLFATGSLPTYGDMLHRRAPARGMRYLTFNDTPMLYWAHKDPQGAMQTFLAGPIHQMTQVGTVPITPATAFLPEIPTADRVVDGWTGLTQETPQTPILFSCAFNLAPELCDVPVSDVFTYTLPTDADPGTYILGTKARREFAGEVIQRAASINVQVGTPMPTSFPDFPIAGMNNNCVACHKGEAALPVAAHGFPGLNKVGAQCLACHTAGYYFEPDADIVTRLRYLHEQSRRLDPPN